MKWLLVLVVLTGCASRPPVQISPVSRVVLVADFTGYGSGVIVRPNLVLTCAHVVEDNSLMLVLPFGQPPQVGRVIKVDAALDLALILISAPSVAPLPLRDPKEGEWVYQMGHPRGQIFALSQGQVILGSGHFQTTAFTLPGSSGAPVFTKSGELAGLVQLYNPLTSHGYFLPSEKIKPFLEAMPLGASGG